MQQPRHRAVHEIKASLQVKKSKAVHGAEVWETREDDIRNKLVYNNLVSASFRK